MSVSAYELLLWCDAEAAMQAVMKTEETIDVCVQVMAEAAHVQLVLIEYAVCAYGKEH